MRSGLLRHVVTIENRQTTRRTTGAVVEDYVPYLVDIAAHILPSGEARGAEQYVAAQVLASVDTKIRIRYRREIDPTMRVRQQVGQGSPTLQYLWDILAVTPADPRNRELWLWCRRREAAGFRSGT